MDELWALRPAPRGDVGELPSFSAKAFDRAASFSQIEFISTAFYLVIVPPSLDQALSIFGSVKGSIPADVAEQALSQFFKIVSGQVGRKAFRFWAPDVPPPSTKSKVLPDGVLKYRLYCYYLDGEAPIEGTSETPTPRLNL